MHKRLAPNASTESAMYAFHRRHHKLTLATLQLVLDYWAICDAIAFGGLLGGLRAACRIFERDTALWEQAPQSGGKE